MQMKITGNVHKVMDNFLASTYFIRDSAQMKQRLFGQDDEIERKMS